MIGSYILKNKRVIKEPDTMKWARWMQDSTERNIDRTNIGPFLISTVFLGLDYDHLFAGEKKKNYKPLIYETMIFYKEDDKIKMAFDGYQDRYRTYKDALEGHKKAVQMVQDHYNQQ